MNSLPSYVAAVVEWLRERGHVINYRQNQHGSYRYKLDGSREPKHWTMHSDGANKRLACNVGHN
jgi:hypothetical protein